MAAQSTRIYCPQAVLNTVAASILLLKQCCVKRRFAVKMTQKSRDGSLSTTAFAEKSVVEALSASAGRAAARTLRLDVLVLLQIIEGLFGRSLERVCVRGFIDKAL